MSIQIIKQETFEGCLPVCLFGISGIKSSKEKELDLLIKGLTKNRDTYYTFNVILSFIESYDLEIDLFVDIKPYANYLSKFNNDHRLKIAHQAINERFIHNQKNPFILYIDQYEINKYTHAPHFIIVEEQDDEYMYIIDPWKGERIKLPKEVILNSIQELKTCFFFSPLLITLKQKKETYE